MAARGGSSSSNLEGATEGGEEKFLERRRRRRRRNWVQGLEVAANERVTRRHCRRYLLMTKLIRSVLLLNISGWSDTQCSQSKTAWGESVVAVAAAVAVAAVAVADRPLNPSQEPQY